MISSILAAALAGIFVIITGTFDLLSLRVLATTALIGGVSITALIGANRLETVAAPLSKWIFLASGAWLVTHLTLIWASSSLESHWLWKSAIVAMVLAISLAHISLLTGTNHNSLQRLIYTLTVMMIVTVAGVIFYTILGPDNAADDLLWRLLATAAILDVLGTIILPVVRRMQRPASIPTVITSPTTNAPPASQPIILLQEDDSLPKP